MEKKMRIRTGWGLSVFAGIALFASSAAQGPLNRRVMIALSACGLSAVAASSARAAFILGAGKAAQGRTFAARLLGRRAGLVAVLLALLCPAAAAPAATISLNFNATAIPAGDTIWFNSIMKLQSATPTTIFFTNSHITFTANATNYDLPVPNAVVNIASAGAESASTTFGGGTWQTNIAGPNALMTTNTWLSGLGFLTPGTGFGNLDVTWTADFTASTAVQLNWQAAAAVYTSFSSDNNALGVKPTDDNDASIYLNADHAGTPENFKTFVIGGGTGGGGSNFTGSYSPTTTVNVPVPEPACLSLLALGSLGLLHRRRRRVSA
jgi:hypothetical protein